MGRWQPYLYDAPQRDSTYQPQSDFNPKAVTIASRLPPPSPTKKADGPLINFNKHPDSYVILPYGKKNAKPMTPKTKTIIKWVRWVQLFFRLCTLLGAIGVLLCAIFIKGAQDTEGYVMRIPPGVDIVVCLYAIYHLLRNAKSRPAGSTASYHFFALVTDAGFIPFYVFTSLLSKRNLNMEAGTSGRWRTVFPTDEEADKILLTLWLTVTTIGGIHIASLFLDLYLLIVFRKISKLPPDMNPLEENLTSRRKTKHKAKNSSISAMAPLTGDDKRFSAQSSNTAVTRNRASHADSYMSEKDIPSPDKSQMAFMHTRNNSEMTYSPHTPNSARQSRERFSMYAQSPSARQSRGDLNNRDDLFRKETNDSEETLAQRKSYLAQQAIKRHSKNNSFATSSSKQDFYTPPATARVEKQDESGDIALQNSREALQSDNWFVHPDSPEHEDPIVAATRSMFNVKPVANGYQSIAATDDVHDEPSPAPARSMFPSKNQTNGYSSLAATDDVPDHGVSPVSSMFFPKTQPKGYSSVSAMDDVSDEEYDPPMAPQPLRMNPPTPPPSKFLNEVKHTPPPPSSLKKTQTAPAMAADASVTRSPTRTSTPKTRYYGDLASATMGIRSGLSPANSPNTSPTKGSFRNGPNNLPSSTKQYTTNSPNSAKKDHAKSSPFTLDKKSFASVRRTGEMSQTPVKNQSPRVVSRSGVDYEGVYDWEDSPNSGTQRRRREVSGKVAEEGRGGITGGYLGGMKAHVLTYRKVSGVA